MTKDREKAIHYLERIKQEYDCSYEEDALDMAIKALKQEPICPSAGIDCEDCPAYEPSGDLISRQAFDEIKELMTDINGDTVYAVRMSDIRQLPSVNPQPYEDAISRQEVLENAFKIYTHECGLVEVVGVATIKELPPVKPQEPKIGHWIEKDDNLYVCSECGQYIYSETEHDLLEFHAFCGRCGARMIEERSE